MTENNCMCSCRGHNFWIFKDVKVGDYLMHLAPCANFFPVLLLYKIHSRCIFVMEIFTSLQYNFIVTHIPSVFRFCFQCNEGEEEKKEKEIVYVEKVCIWKKILSCLKLHILSIYPTFLFVCFFSLFFF